IESQLIEKLVARALRNSRKEGGAGAGAGGVGEGEAAVSNENLRQACEQIFQEYVDQRLIQSLQKEIRQVVQNKLLEFGNSEAFKALLDGRFRIMENYLRGEVIPKAIERHLEKGTA
ncbi:MAG: hypothetical protein HY717_11690, partial [Planctomycetes bacterium]|nr:hypothetical protein [Planctomycetota bacterium]